MHSSKKYWQILIRQEHQDFIHQPIFLRCGWFTFFPNFKICQLLYNCTNIDVGLCPSCLGGPAGCEPPAPQCWVQGQCQGNLLQTIPAATQEECLDQCKATQGCKWFTFGDDPAPFCLLFHDCPILDETCSSCISGEGRCQVYDGGKGLLVTMCDLIL